MILKIYSHLKDVDSFYEFVMISELKALLCGQNPRVLFFLLCVHHQPASVSEENDSQERKSRKSSQGQQVQDQATATVNERSADGKSTEQIRTM